MRVERGLPGDWTRTADQPRLLLESEILDGIMLAREWTFTWESTPAAGVPPPPRPVLRAGESLLDPVSDTLSELSWVSEGSVWVRFAELEAVAAGSG